MIPFPPTPYYSFPPYKPYYYSISSSLMILTLPSIPITVPFLFFTTPFPLSHFLSLPNARFVEIHKRYSYRVSLPASCSCSVSSERQYPYKGCHWPWPHHNAAGHQGHTWKTWAWEYSSVYGEKGEKMSHDLFNG